MSYPATEPATKGLQHPEKRLVSVALVQEDRYLYVGGDLKLGLKRPALVRAGRKVPIEIQAALARCDHFVMCEQLSQCHGTVFVEPGGIVRVNAGGREQRAWTNPGQFQCTNTLRYRGAGDDQPAHAGGTSLSQHLVAIPIKTLMSQIGADIDQVHHGCWA